MGGLGCVWGSELEVNGRARSPTHEPGPLLLPLLHSEWRRVQGRGGTPFASRDRSRGNEPPLPIPLLPRREERGKSRDCSRENGPPLPIPLLPQREERGKIRTSWASADLGAVSPGDPQLCNRHSPLPASSRCQRVARRVVLRFHDSFLPLLGPDPIGVAIGEGGVAAVFAVAVVNVW